MGQSTAQLPEQREAVNIGTQSHVLRTVSMLRCPVFQVGVHVF